MAVPLPLARPRLEKVQLVTMRFPLEMNTAELVMERMESRSVVVGAMEMEVSVRDAESTLKREVVITFVRLSWKDILSKVTVADEEIVKTGLESVTDSTDLTAVKE